MSVNNSFSKFKVDAASAFAAVCAYHPWRSIATRAMAGQPFTANPRCLYSGFVPSVASAHQLFLMSYAYRTIHVKNENAKAIIAGAISAPTTTICEARVSRKLANISISSKSLAVAFRGFTPTLWRQAGLGLGIFIFPKKIEDALSSVAPLPYKEVTYPLAGSVIAALLTHYPDTVRVVMQSQQHLAISDACQVASRRMMSQTGATTCFLRVCVLSIAFTTMRLGKKYFPAILNSEES